MSNIQVNIETSRTTRVRSVRSEELVKAVRSRSTPSLHTDGVSVMLQPSRDLVTTDVRLVIVDDH